MPGQFPRTAKMKQAIAGVTPADTREVTVMMTWPSVAGMGIGPIPMGRIMGQLFNIQAGAYIFTVGNLLALLMAPLGIVLYFQRIGPLVAQRYRVTNRRIVVERGLSAQEEKAIELDRFDNIEIEVLDGYEWFDAGDLVFKSGEIEKFRLVAVPRPKSFHSVCEKARMGYVGVQKALHQVA